MRKNELPFERGPVEETGEADFFSCYVMGEPWRYALVTQEQMKALAEDVAEDPSGLCVSETSTIYFLKGHVSHTIAIHELMHVYFAETLTHSAKLTADQTEEVMCDIAAFNWCRIILLAHLMVHNLMCYERWVAGEKEQDWKPAPADVIDGRVGENICDMIATYVSSCGSNPLLKAARAKKKRPRPSPKK